MADSILDSVKKTLGVDSDYDVFDADILTHINSTFLTLSQIGVGPVMGYMIEDSDPTWDDFLGKDSRLIAVKSYMYLKVRLLFDPPPTSFHITAIEKQISELEWRLNLQAEAPTVDGTQVIVLGDVQ